MGDNFMKILIVEDSALMRRVASEVIEKKGYKPILAENGAEALANLRKHEKDIGLIIMDWNMPVMDGYEALTKIRSQDQYNHIPIIMATADGLREDVMKAVKAGVDAYLVKPYTPEALAKQIDDCLAEKAPVK
jgi:two-component system chemotaxis response regulator CheY